MATSRFLKALDPAAPVVGYAVLYPLVILLDIQSEIGALGVGVGFGVVLIVGALLSGRLLRAPDDQPLLQPRLVPWGVGFILVGTGMWLSAAPWRYWGAGLGTLGILYIVAGSIAWRGASRAAR